MIISQDCICYLFFMFHKFCVTLKCSWTKVRKVSLSTKCLNHFHPDSNVMFCSVRKPEACTKFHYIPSFTSSKSGAGVNRRVAEPLPPAEVCFCRLRFKIWPFKIITRQTISTVGQPRFPDMCYLGRKLHDLSPTLGANGCTRLGKYFVGLLCCSFSPPLSHTDRSNRR